MSSTIQVELEKWHGYSAYELAKKNGFEGTEEEYLASLHGRDGGVATVNGVAHDDDGNVALTAGNIPISEEDSRTMAEVAAEHDKISNAITVTDDALDVGGRYIDNALFR